MDRLITIRLDHYDRATEVSITTARSGIGEEDAEIIVDIVRELRNVGVNNHLPTIRACIAVARVLTIRGARARPDDPVFKWVLRDILNTNTAKVTHDGHSIMEEKLDEVLETVFESRATTPER
jgi:hypothetical protein